MCGIVGIVNNVDAVDREILERMNCAIVHRGPDEDGFYLNGQCRPRDAPALDHRSRERPAADPQRGQDEMDRLQRRDLQLSGAATRARRTRPQVLHKIGHRSGRSSLRRSTAPIAFSHLRGMFAFAIWDERERSLFIARDRVGKKPLLYSHQPNGDLIFGSEFHGAARASGRFARGRSRGHRRLHVVSLRPGAARPRSKQIRKLEPGHWLRWKDGKIETQRYWLPDFSKKIKIIGERSDRRDDAHPARIDAAADDLGGAARCISLGRRRFIDGRRADGAGELDGR